MEQTLHRLVRIDHLISCKSTGTPAEFAHKIGLSERSLYEYIKLLKKFGAPVVYSRARGSYQYSEEGRFQIAFLPTS